MKAAVLREVNTPLEVEDIKIDKPGPREVLLRTAATGVCHSDLHVVTGSLPNPLPVVLGHEPSGVVEAVGADVSQFAPGDHVIGCLTVFCGSCVNCYRGKPYLCDNQDSCRRGAEEPARLSKYGTAIDPAFHLGSYAEQMLVHENALVKIRDDMPLDRAALIGCGVTTGLGAVLNTAKVEPGSTVVVIGCGGVGLSAVQGARIAGASRIIAVDKEDWKLELAKKVGATDGIVGGPDMVKQIKGLTSDTVDYCFECIGIPELITQGFRVIRRGGTMVSVGVTGFKDMVELRGLEFLNAKTVMGSLMGSVSFRTDMPRYVDYYLRGELKLDEMISHRMQLDEINSAFDNMQKGTAARAVITFDS